MRISLYAAFVVIGVWWAILMLVALAASQNLPEYGVTEINYVWYFLLPPAGILLSAALAFWLHRTRQLQGVIVATAALLLATVFLSIQRYASLALVWFLSVIGSA